MAQLSKLEASSASGHLQTAHLGQVIRGWSAGEVGIDFNVQANEEHDLLAGTLRIFLNDTEALELAQRLIKAVLAGK